MNTTSLSIEELAKLYQTYKTDALRRTQRPVVRPDEGTVEDRIERENPFYTRLQIVNYGR